MFVEKWSFHYVVSLHIIQKRRLINNKLKRDLKPTVINSVKRRVPNEATVNLVLIMHVFQFYVNTGL